MAHEWSTPVGGDPVRPRPRARWIFGAIALGLVLLGASQTGLVGRDGLLLTSAESETEDPEGSEDAVEEIPEEHAAAVADYWEARADAFTTGAAEGVTFVARNLHPALGYDPEECVSAWFPDGVPGELGQTVTADLDTLVADPDWRMPHGPLHDTQLAGPVYRVNVRTVLTGLPSGVDVDRTVAVHLAMVDGRARGFGACVEPTVARAIITRLTEESETTSTPAPAPQTIPAPAVEPAPAPIDDTSPQAAPGEMPDPVVAPWPEEELTVEEELRAVLTLIDGLLQSGDLSVAEAIDLLAELASAPELDADQRELVRQNLQLLRDHDPREDPPRLILELKPGTEPHPPGAWLPQPSWTPGPSIAAVTYEGCTLADGAAHAAYTIELADAGGYRLLAADHTADGDLHTGGLLDDHDGPTLTEWEEVFSGSHARTFSVPSFDALTLEPLAGGTPVVLEIDDEDRTATGSASCDLD